METNTKTGESKQLDEREKDGVSHQDEDNTGHSSTGLGGVQKILKSCWKRICYESKEHTFFFISLVAAIITCFFNTPKWGYIDVKVLVCLFELMLIVKALEKYGLLGHIAVNIVNRCRNQRQLTMGLCIIAFFLSMFATNDVAILTVVPILIIIAQTCEFSATVPCVLITIAANLGSSTTPIGNPQNLYIFSFYVMDLLEFFKAALPLSIISLALLLGLSFFIKPTKIHTGLDTVPITEKKKATAFLVLAVPVIAGVMNLIPYSITLALVIVTALFLDKGLMRKVDYRLLLTFLFLFIAVGNISHIPALREKLSALAATPFRTYLSSLLLSQVISNVPSTVMLAPFTVLPHAQALFYGVNIGGLGTPIASLASIIAYSLFSQTFAKQKLDFMKKFLVLHFTLLIILGTIFGFIVKFTM